MRGAVVRSEPLQPYDLELVEAAKSVIGRCFRLDWHHVGCALRSRSGRVYTSVNLEANVGRVAVCAEPIAVGQAAAAGDADLEVIVGVLHRYDESDPVEFRAGTPCGICRELLNDYMPVGHVIVPLEGELRRVRVRDLLPERYNREVGALA
jgi:cytidine deaminase